MRRFAVVKGFENKGVILPTRATGGSAGYDIRVKTDGDIMISPNETYVFDTGIKASMEKDEVLLIYVRSSVGIKRNLTLANSTAVVDADFYNNEENEGHIKIALRNNSNTSCIIKDNERVAQGIFMKYLTTDDDNVVIERTGGIGSTNYER